LAINLDGLSPEGQTLAKHKCQALMYYEFVLMIFIWLGIQGYQVHISDLYTNEKLQQEYAQDKERQLTIARAKAKESGNIYKLKQDLEKMKLQAQDLVKQKMEGQIKKQFNTFAIN
jgi:Tfp pilus assembly protein PilO